MKTDRGLLRMVMLLSVLFVLTTGACGCSRKEPGMFEQAATLFGEGRYEEAEVFFLAALEEENPPAEAVLGHAYNLAALNDNVKALDELIRADMMFTDNSLRIELRRTMLELYAAEKNLPAAARVCEELSRLYGPGESEEYYLLEAAIIRADIARAQKDSSALEENLRKIIGLKTFAQDEYLELYKLFDAPGKREEQLKLADEILGYMTGHSAYISDYGPVLGILLDAAQVAEYTEGAHDSDFYFAAAEVFIGLAEEKQISDSELLKYKIVLDEKKGKLELAYKLLGVYINHCPEDKKALKEQDYLHLRLGIEAP